MTTRSFVSNVNCISPHLLFHARSNDITGGSPIYAQLLSHSNIPISLEATSDKLRASWRTGAQACASGMTRHSFSREPPKRNTHLLLFKHVSHYAHDDSISRKRAKNSSYCPHAYAMFLDPHPRRSAPLPQDLRPEARIKRRSMFGHRPRGRGLWHSGSKPASTVSANLQYRLSLISKNSYTA